MQDLFGEDTPMQHRTPVLDVTSHAFQPKKYIQRVLANVPHAVFEGELVDRVGQAEEETGEALKQLIRDNLAVFVNSKDAMDAVFHSDHELFTGEALEGITDSFKAATNSCDSLVQPLAATFVDIQKSRKSQDMLDKLFSVLGVPGAIYDSCGAKVALRRASALGTANGNDEDNDEEEEEEEEKADDRGSHGDAPGDRDDADEEDEEDEEDDDGYGGGGGKWRRSASSAAAPAAKPAARRRSDLRYSGDSEAEDDEEDDDDAADPAAGVAAGGGLPSAAHGTLENPGGAASLADTYVFASPREEIYFWYGTPLVRLRDVDERRHHVELVSNYEAAVLHLRRAMLYVEETYSLLDGTLLVGEDGDVPPRPAGTAAAAAGASSPSPSPGPQAAGGSVAAVGTVSRSTFAYKFAMALLRSALYLGSQLAEELVYANPADTVLIEDTLSMMMDASIATVKLRHFCGVLQRAIEQGKQRRQSLTRLRAQFSTADGDGGAASPSASAAAGGTSFAAQGPSNSGGNFSASPSGGIEAASPSSASARRRPPVYQHPVQYFISIVQKQHRHLFYSSAAGLLQEAKAWMWKAQTDAARTLEERHRQRELQRKLRVAAAHGLDVGEDANAALGGTMGTFGPTLANSFMGASVAGDGGFIGNSNDSFLQDTSFGWLNRRGGPASPTAEKAAAGSPTRDGERKGLASSYTAAAATASGTAASGAGGVDGQQFVSLVPDHFVTRILDAFNTPETPFPTTTEFKVGAADMDAVLLSSCLQIRLHAASLLSQLFTRADVEAAVMAQGPSLNSFALRLCAECIGTLEHVVGSYWGGIATTLHAGVFDFTPDGPLRAMLMELVSDSAENAAAAQAAAPGDTDGLQRSPSTMLGIGGSREHSLSPSFAERAGPLPAGAREGDRNSTASKQNGGSGGGGEAGAAHTLGGGPSLADQLPRVRFVPCLPQSLQTSSDADNKAASVSRDKADDTPAGPACLRDLSVQAVNQMISTATTTLESLFLAFINKSVVDAFVGTMARYHVSDAVRHSRTERVELHAAVLYEVILGQWERMMGLVSDSVLRLKIVIGESSSSATITSDGQVEEVGNLLQALETLRSTCLRTYLHGVGALSKAYLTMLPLLQRRTNAALDARVRSRLSRDSVSSNTVHKLLNVLSVVVDRCVPFFTRDAEVYDSVDLFSVKAETLPDDNAANDDDDDGRGGGGGGAGSRGGGRRLRLMRSRRGAAAAAPADSARRGSRSGTGRDASSSSTAAAATAAPSPAAGGPDTTTDPISELLADFHGKLVVESLQDHEELVLALLSHLLLAFVDTLQLKCRTATTDLSIRAEERERSVVECMADTLSLATTLTPILMEHLLSPCFFELLARQLPDVAASPAEVVAYLNSKQQQYVQVYLSVVEEHCQLAVDAMMNTYLALTQQPITDYVRRQGFVQPLFDWQRVSPHTTAAVRPYIADSIACIARAHETLNAIRQPILGSAATQRLVAHLVRVFLTAFTSDINVFELSVECSSNFLVLGLTLLEAEALTILKVAEAVVAHAAANPNTSELSPELAVARESLASFTQSLDAYSTSVCDAIAASRSRDGASDAAVSLSFLAKDKRLARRDGMVQAAMRTLGYMLEAINVELEESSLSSAGLLQPRSSVTESIVQRLEQRNEGYELRRAKAAQKEQERKEAERRSEKTRKRVVTVVDTAGVAEADGGGAAGSARQRRVVQRRPDGLKPLARTGVAEGNADDDGAAAGGSVLTPRTAQEQDKEASSALALATNVFQLAQDQQLKTRVRKVKKTRKAAPELAEVAAAGGEEKASHAVAASTPSTPPPAAAAVAEGVGEEGDVPAARARRAARQPPPVQRRAAHNDDDNDDDGDGAPMRARPARRARRGAAASDAGDGDGGAEPRERRANRFRRSNVV